MFKIPKNDEKYRWTNHVIRKMAFYGLTPDRVKRVIRNPKRSEKGIVPDTIAVMQPAGTPRKPTEIWVMYSFASPKRKSILTCPERLVVSEVESSRGSESKELALSLSKGFNKENFSPPQKIIITAWRYPGVSPIRDEIPIPVNILRELREEGIEWQ